MWIRSQDGTELINSNRIQADGKVIYAFEGVSVDDCGFITMGKYPTKERALKVLDNISESIFCIENDKSYNITITAEYCRRDLFPVYQMPKE